MNKGFTLIEIIATLILLGCLTGVIIPRYLDIVDDAKIASLNRAIAAGQAQITTASGKYLLLTGDLPTSVADLTSNAISLETAIGDYTLAFGDGTQDGQGGVSITANDGDGNTASGFQPWPQAW